MNEHKANDERVNEGAVEECLVLRLKRDAPAVASVSVN